MYTKTVEPIPAPVGNATSKAADKQNNTPRKMTDDEIMEKLSMQSTHTLKIMNHSPTVFLALVKHYSLYLFFSSFSGTIVSIGDPKKKYTRYDKIGQGWVLILATVYTEKCENV